MGRLRYRIVDVFAERPLEGNPLCVVLDPCRPELMQQIAREVNLSETTFPVRTAENAYKMRIFTPTVELAFAGHPTLGTAWSLGPGQWTQTTSGATVTVDADEHGATMSQPVPAFSSVDDQADRVLSALGLTSAQSITRSTAGGVTHILVATSEPLDRLTPDPEAVARISRVCNAHTLVPMREVNETTVHARVFASAAGVAEDPGSGSAAGPIGLLAHQLWGTSTTVTVTMGTEIGRPSRLYVETAETLRVGGRVILSAEGQLFV